MNKIKIEDIKDGWKLKNGNLYLLVKGKDNVIRSVIVEINKPH